MINSTFWFILGGISYSLFFAAIDFIVRKIDDKRETEDAVDISIDNNKKTMFAKFTSVYLSNGKEKKSAQFTISDDKYDKFMNDFNKEINKD